MLYCFFFRSLFFKYNIDTNQFSSETKHIDGSRDAVPSMNIYFFPEKNIFMLICQDYNDGIKTLFEADCSNKIYNYGGTGY